MRKEIFAIIALTAVFWSGMVNMARAEQAEIRFAITSAVASDPSYSGYKLLTDYVAGKMGRKSAFISGLSYNQVDDLFIDHKVDVGFLCNTHFARQRNVVGFQALAVPVIEGYGKPKFQVYIIVNKDSGIKSLKDLKGKTVDFSDPLSTTNIYAAYLLKKRNQTIRSYFGKAIYSGSHDMTVRLVANKMVDAGFIDGHIWDFHERVRPEYSSKTRVIQRSPDFTMPPVVVSKSMPEEVRRKMAGILLSMHEDSVGREILKKLRIEKFVAARDDDYQDVLRMYNTVRSSLIKGSD